MSVAFITDYRRLWVGLVLVLSLILFITATANIIIAMLFGIIALILGWEWGRLVYSTRYLVYLKLLLLAVLLVVVWQLLEMSPVWVINGLIYLAATWWFIMFLLVAAYDIDWLHSNWLGWFFRLGLPLVLLSSWTVVVELHRIDYLWLLYLVTLVGTVDTAAYYCGRRWGREKLIPALSPGKSRAGLWGALVGVLLFSLIVVLFSNKDWQQGLYLILLSLFIALFCIVGDFAESMLKRRNGVKDSGTWLPGHGGVFDRADSFLAAAPWFFLFAPLTEGLR